MPETQNILTDRMFVPIWRKANLSVKEASIYSGIGETSIREMVSEKGCKFSFKVGNKWLINRELFEKYFLNLCGGNK